VVTHLRRAGGRARVAECKVMLECDIMTNRHLQSSKDKPEFESPALTVHCSKMNILHPMKQSQWLIYTVSHLPTRLQHRPLSGETCRWVIMLYLRTWESTQGTI
jgi:hypothetical protein